MGNKRKSVQNKTANERKFKNKTRPNYGPAPTSRFWRHATQIWEGTYCKPQFCHVKKSSWEKERLWRPLVGYPRLRDLWKDIEFDQNQKNTSKNDRPVIHHDSSLFSWDFNMRSLEEKLLRVIQGGLDLEILTLATAAATNGQFYRMWLKQL